MPDLVGYDVTLEMTSVRSAGCSQSSSPRSAVSRHGHSPGVSATSGAATLGPDAHLRLEHLTWAPLGS